MISIGLFLLCFITSTLLFLGGVSDQTRPTDLSFPVFLPLAILDIFLLIGFIFYEYKTNKTKINIPLIIILSALFFINLIVIITTPLNNVFEYINKGEDVFKEVTITNEYKVMYIICFLLLLLNIYISFIYLLNHVHFNKQFMWLCIMGIAIGIFMVIYSYITEWNTYRLFIENIATTARSYNPKSITNNQNSYAAILLGAMFCSYGLYAVTDKHICRIIGVFFWINIFFPMSRICLVLSVLLSLMIFAYKMFISYKGNEKRNIILILIVISILLIFLILYLSITPMREYIENVIFTRNSSLISRLPLWETTLSMTTSVHNLFGNGHGYYNTALATITDGSLKMPHNLYVQIFGSLGVIGLLAFISLIAFIIYKITVLYKNNKEASLISIIGLITILIYYIVEG